MEDNAVKNVLIIEDDPSVRKLLRMVLESETVNVSEAAKGKDGLVELAKNPPDLLILDLGLPDIDGRVVLRRLREWSDIPVLVLSAREEIDDKVDALDCGAQDYVTKPFNSKERLARVRVALMSQAPEPEPLFVRGELVIDFSARVVKVSGEVLHLTPIEYTILRLLAKNKGKIVMTSQIKNTIWGNVLSSTDEQLRVHMAMLRKKFRNRGIDNLIKNKIGVGYILAD